MITYYTDRLEKLVGGKIVGVVTDEEFFGFVVQVRNKRVVLWFLQDDEGNGPGSFELNDC